MLILYYIEYIYIIYNYYTILYSNVINISKHIPNYLYY